VTVEVFMSWSREQSREITVLLERFIRQVIPGTEIFMSAKNLEAGHRWSTVLAEKLDKSDVGIFVVTPSNLRSRWLNFEAGAIAKRLESARVIPLLFNIDKRDLTGPLAEFQALEWSKPACLSLLQIVNRATGSRVEPTELVEDFEERWPDLERKVAAVPGPISINTPLRYLLGDSAQGELIRLVFPRFTVNSTISERLREEIEVLSPGIREPLQTLLDDDSLSSLLDSPGQREGGRGIDDVRAFAMNDLRALCTVADRLGKEEAKSQPVPDVDVHHEGEYLPLVLFGLTTNRITNLFLESSKLTGDAPLFEEVMVGGRKAVRLIDGRVYTYDDDNYGLIARVTPPNYDPRSRWLICAGLGPTGTEAAANYLCANGQELARSVGVRDFVKVVTCRTRMPHAFHSTAADTIFADGTSAAA
jgi:hypothetical protein